MKNKDRNEENLENSAAVNPEKSSGETISKAESEKIISNQEQENMEVHKHPHHVTDKKKLAKYLLEFLMIFLAVTMGFFAENIRENTVEKRIEKQLMISLVRDLELDTLDLSAGIEYSAQKIQAIDSALILLPELKTSLIPGKVYNLSLKFWACRNFYQNSGTLDQLKNSGSFRLISNRKVVDAIEAYDQHVKRMTVTKDVEIQEFLYNDRLSQKLFDAKSVLRLPRFSEYPFLISDPSALIKINLSYLNEYINNLMTYSPVVKGNALLFESSKQDALDLIRMIKKEYHLE